jgi:hypothetical protein
MKYQGKRKDQVDFSNLMTMVGMIGIALTLLLVIPLLNIGTPKEIKPTHEYWLPGEDTNKINDTLSYSDEYKMWIGGNGDTIWE